MRFFSWFVFFGFGVKSENNQPTGEDMKKGRVSETLIQSAAASGSAAFYFEDFQSVTIALAAVNGTSPVAAYDVKLYADVTTPDAFAYTYKTQSPAASVLVFENVTDSNGVPFNFYKMVISYSGLANSGGDAPVFIASVSAS